MSRLALGALAAGAAFFALGCPVAPAIGGRPPTYKAEPRTLALQPLVVFQNAVGPISQQTATLRDVHAVLPARRVTAEECHQAIQLPFGFLLGTSVFSASAGWGEGGYQAALARAQKDAADGVLVDVRVDLRSVSLMLGVFVQQCVVVDAGVVPQEALFEQSPAEAVPTPPPVPAPATPAPDAGAPANP